MCTQYGQKKPLACLPCLPCFFTTAVQTTRGQYFYYSTVVNHARPLSPGHLVTTTCHVHVCNLCTTTTTTTTCRSYYIGMHACARMVYVYIYVHVLTSYSPFHVIFTHPFSTMALLPHAGFSCAATNNGCFTGV